MRADAREGGGLCLRPSQQPSDPPHMGTAFKPAKTSLASWDAFSDVDAFVDAVLAELAAMVADGTRSTRSGPKSLHMFTKPTGIFINPATCASTIAGTSRGRRQAPPQGGGPAVGV